MCFIVIDLFEEDDEESESESYIDDLVEEDDDDDVGNDDLNRTPPTRTSNRSLSKITYKEVEENDPNDE